MLSSGGGGGRFGVDPSTSTSTEPPRQLPSFGHGGWGGGGGDQLAPSYPVGEAYVACVGKNGHPGGCSQHGRPGGNGSTGMLSAAAGDRSFAAAPVAPCRGQTPEALAGASDTAASTSSLSVQHGNETPGEQDLDVFGGAGHDQARLSPWIVSDRPYDDRPSLVRETHGQEGGTMRPRGDQTLSGFPVETALANIRGRPVNQHTFLRCKYQQCPNAPKYGFKYQPPRFCRSHKRVGMYSTRPGNRWMVATRDGDAIREARSTESPGGGTMTRSALDDVGEPTEASRLAAECRPPSVPSPAEVGDVRARPGAGPIETKSGTPLSVAQPIPASKLAVDRHLLPVPSPTGAGDKETRPDVGATGALSETSPSGARPTPTSRLAAERRPPSAPTSPTEARDESTTPNLGTNGTLSKASSSVARPIQTRGRTPCDFPGCRVHPNVNGSDGKPARFCYKHRSKTGAGTLKTKSRVCIRQGCNTQAHYGLPTGRQLYCSRHKANGTVCILKGGMVLATENAARKKVKKVANRELQSGGNGLTVENIDAVDPAADAEVNGGGDLTGHVQDNAGAATSTSSSSLLSRPVFGGDTSPLADIKLLHKARKSAQDKEAASGSGKRPKIPSRKALEASGVAGVVQDAPQLMTKEIREAMAPRTSRRMKGQRTRVEGDCARNCFTGQAAGDAAGSGGFIGRFGGNGCSSVGAAGEDASPSSREILEEYPQQRRHHQQQYQQQKIQQQQQKQQQQQRSASLTPRQRQSSTVTTTGASASQRRPGDAASSRGVGDVDTKKTTKTNKRRGDVADKNRDTKAKKKHTSTSGGVQDEGKEGAIVTEPTTLCAFENCRAGATYGVNNIVRYCQNHRLFGMYKIP